MTKEYYKKLLDGIEEIEHLSTKSTSIFNLAQSDSDLSYDDRQELILHLAMICISGIRAYGDNLIKNPLTSSTEIDDYNKRMDDLINYKTDTSKKDNYKNN